jgi:deazaflavin-dependent oxidoreductase (nitroreductase family)
MYVAERKRNPFINSPRGGRILSAVTFSPFWILPPAGFGVLTTTGRKTGKRRRKCVRAVRRGGKAYLVSIRPTGWLQNARANPQVRLKIKSGTFAGTAREPADAAERQEAKAAYCGDVHPNDYVECALWRRGRPTRAKIQELHRDWFEQGTPLVVELDT